MDPGAAPVRTWAVARADRRIAAGLTVVAAAVRLAFATLPPYGDEAAHYAVSRGLGQVPGNIEPPADVTDWLFWQRPLFSLLLSPGAQMGFEGYRAWNALLVALVPALLYALARSAGAGRVAAGFVAGVAALHPSIVLWSVRVFPDALMTTLVLGGLALHRLERRVAATVALLAATWVKEPAGLALAACAALNAVRGWRAGDNRLWTLRLDRPTTAGLYALVAAPLPLLASVFLLGGVPPGWSSTPLHLSHLDAFFLSAWLLVPILAALAAPASRGLAAWAFLYPAFYVGYALTGGGVEAWYLVLPSCLALAAAGPGLSVLAARIPALTRPPARWAAVALAIVLCAAWAFTPAATPGKGLVAPAGGSQSSLQHAAAVAASDTSLRDAVDAAQGTGRDQVLAVDVGWFYVFYPLAEAFDRVVWAYTHQESDVDALAPRINGDVVMLVQKDPKPSNGLLLERYSACTVWQDDGHAVILADQC